MTKLMTLAILSALLAPACTSDEGGDDTADIGGETLHGPKGDPVAGCTMEMRYPNGQVETQPCQQLASPSAQVRVCSIAEAASGDGCATVAYFAGEFNGGPFATFSIGHSDLAALAQLDGEGSMTIALADPSAPKEGFPTAGTFYNEKGSQKLYVCGGAAGTALNVVGSGSHGTVTVPTSCLSGGDGTREPGTLVVKY